MAPLMNPLTSRVAKTAVPAKPAKPQALTAPTTPQTPVAPTAIGDPRPKGAPRAIPPITSSVGDGFASPIYRNPGTPPAPGTGLTQVAPPTAIPAQSVAPVPAPAPSPSPTGASPYTLTPTNPSNPLTAQTITAGPGVDRFAVANQAYNDFIAQTDPSYQAVLRDANRMAAAGGGLGSGMLRTSLGNLADQRATALQTERSGLFRDALLGSVDDARYATGVAQQQQGFQSGQQDQAFNQALQRWLAGQQGGTGSGTVLSGANQAGGNAQAATEALRQWLGARAASPSSPATPPIAAPAGGEAMPEWLRATIGAGLL